MSPLGPTWDFFFLSPHAVALCGGVCGMMEQGFTPCRAHRGFLG